MTARYEAWGRAARALRPAARAGWVACLVAVASAATADDRHAGYYYPNPSASEIYVARAQTLPDSDRRRRVLFVTELTAQMLALPYAPTHAVYAKGEHAEKLIITSLHADWYGTLYRMRALLAQMTAMARTTPMFREFEVDDLFTFLDLLKLLGFRQLTVTDGERYAHQYLIE